MPGWSKTSEPTSIHRHYPLPRLSPPRASFIGETSIGGAARNPLCQTLLSWRSKLPASPDQLNHTIHHNYTTKSPRPATRKCQKTPKTGEIRPFRRSQKKTAKLPKKITADRDSTQGHSNKAVVVEEADSSGPASSGASAAAAAQHCSADSAQPAKPSSIQQVAPVESSG
jgi:hypothetical protein